MTDEAVAGPRGKICRFANRLRSGLNHGLYAADRPHMSFANLTGLVASAVFGAAATAVVIIDGVWAFANCRDPGLLEQDTCSTGMPRLLAFFIVAVLLDWVALVLFRRRRAGIARQRDAVAPLGSPRRLSSGLDEAIESRRPRK